MLKKTITYTDYNGLERTEDLYFHLTKAEIMQMEMSTTGGLAEKIQRIVAAQDAPNIIKVFKELLLASYGEKSDDGRRFNKIDDKGCPLSASFEQTEAFSIMFMELATDDNAAASFIKAVLPNDLATEVEKKQLNNNQN